MYQFMTIPTIIFCGGKTTLAFKCLYETCVEANGHTNYNFLILPNKCTMSTCNAERHLVPRVYGSITFTPIFTMAVSANKNTSK